LTITGGYDAEAWRLAGVVGIGSFVLNQLGREFILLSWIDTWGASTGNGIRIAMTLVGAGLWFAGRGQESGE
jgi:hypothetical protein